MYPHRKSDRLVSVRKNGVVLGKRIGKNCPISKEEAREFVLNGSIDAIKKIRDGRGCGLSEAYNLLQSARNGRW